MHGVSSQTEKRIIELWFKGFPRDAIARRVGVSGSTVSKVIGQLPECLRELRNLSVELRKSNGSPSEALKGAKLLSKLSDLGVELDQLADSVKAVRKLSKKAKYPPKQVIQGAMHLFNLEEESGKSYSEAMKEFGNKTEQVKRLSERILTLEQEIVKKEEKRKQKLRQSGITEKEIKHVKEIRQNLRKYGIRLTDAQNLQKYLKNMEETGANPRNFVKFARKIGSLKGRLTFLQNQKQQKTVELDEIKKEKDSVENELYVLKTTMSKLRREELEIKGRLGGLQEQVDQQRGRHEAAVLSLAEILRVKASVDEINSAIEAKNNELADLETVVAREQRKLETLNSEIEELERNRQSLEHEVEKTLNIKNYAVQIKKAIADLEQQESGLEKEIAEKKERIALADTITNFLTRQTTYDFNLLRSMVETVKRIREDKSSPLKFLLLRTEEKIRMQALKAFEGDTVSKIEHEMLWKRKEEYRKGIIERDEKITELEIELKRKDDDLAHVQKEKKNLEKIKVYVEGGQRTVNEIREWTKDTCEEEIERRANEEFDKLAAGAKGALEWIHGKITKKGKLS